MGGLSTLKRSCACRDPRLKSPRGRKISIRRRHGGRGARVRGTERIARDFAMLATSVNLARLAVLGVRGDTSQPTA